MPYKVQEKKREAWRRKGRGYPGPYGGLLNGRKAAAKARNKKLRRQQDAALKAGRELPVRKKQVTWDIT